MRQFAAASIDRGIDKVEPQQENPAVTPCSVGKAKDGRLQALPRQHAQTWHRLSEINDHLFEGRRCGWTEKKHARNVCAYTREECETKLKVLIICGNPQVTIR